MRTLGICLQKLGLTNIIRTCRHSKQEFAIKLNSSPNACWALLMAVYLLSHIFRSKVSKLIHFFGFTSAHRREGDKASLIFLASRISRKYVRINAIFQNRYTLEERAKWVSRTNKSDLNGSNTVNTYIWCVFPQDKRLYVHPSICFRL